MLVQLGTGGHLQYYDPNSKKSDKNPRNCSCDPLKKHIECQFDDYVPFEDQRKLLKIPSFLLLQSLTKFVENVIFAAIIKHLFRFFQAPLSSLDAPPP